MLDLNADRPASSLQRFIQRTVPVVEPQEQCDLCSEPIPHQHRHLLEMASREIRCVCRACSILFDKEAASLGKHRLIPDRHLYLEHFQMSDAQWESLHIPVGMAFLFFSTTAGQVVAFYPSPMGPTEASVTLSAWQELEANNPVLQGMEHDVEAFLVNRARGARQYFLVPLDECYHLIGLIRLHWKGLGGGQEVWQEVGRFFEELKERSKTV